MACVGENIVMNMIPVGFFVGWSSLWLAPDEVSASVAELRFADYCHASLMKSWNRARAGLFVEGGHVGGKVFARGS